jgi:hypothetical protein
LSERESDRGRVARKRDIERGRAKETREDRMHNNLEEFYRGPRP